MKTNRFTLIILSFVLIVSIDGCVTFQALPTNTPVPTNTPIPTNTLLPTDTPAKPIVGIDTPITIVMKDLSVITFKVFSANITTNPTIISGAVLTPGIGQSVLVVHAYFTGNIAALFVLNGAVFFIEDESLLYPGWKQYQIHDNIVDIAFIVQTGAEPYQLHVNYLDEWYINLTRIMGK